MDSFMTWFTPVHLPQRGGARGWGHYRHRQQQTERTTTSTAAPIVSQGPIGEGLEDNDQVSCVSWDSLFLHENVHGPVNSFSPDPNKMLALVYYLMYNIQTFSNWQSALHTVANIQSVGSFPFEVFLHCNFMVQFGLLCFQNVWDGDVNLWASMLMPIEWLMACIFLKPNLAFTVAHWWYQHQWSDGNGIKEGKHKWRWPWGALSIRRPRNTTLWGFRWGLVIAIGWYWTCSSATNWRYLLVCYREQTVAS